MSRKCLNFWHVWIALMANFGPPKKLRLYQRFHVYDVFFASVLWPVVAPRQPSTMAAMRRLKFGRRTTGSIVRRVFFAGCQVRQFRLRRRERWWSHVMLRLAVDSGIHELSDYIRLWYSKVVILSMCMVYRYTLRIPPVIKHGNGKWTVEQ